MNQIEAIQKATKAHGPLQKSMQGGWMFVAPFYVVGGAKRHVHCGDFSVALQTRAFSIARCALTLLGYDEGHATLWAAAGGSVKERVARAVRCVPRKLQRQAGGGDYHASLRR